MGLGTLVLMGMLWAPGQAPPTDVVHPVNVAKLDIPITYDPKQKALIQEMLLYVSKNQGESWEQYATAKPDRDTFFPFVAERDGVYWFQMVIVNINGSREPADPKTATKRPLKVLIDTKKPVIAIKSADRVGDDATVNWTIQEANPDWTRFQVEYRFGGDNIWLPVVANPAFAGSARFRVSQPGAMTVRVRMGDTAGNLSEMAMDIPAPANLTTVGGVAVPPVVSAPSGPSVVVPPDGPSMGGLVEPMVSAPLVQPQVQAVGRVQEKPVFQGSNSAPKVVSEKVEIPSEPAISSTSPLAVSSPRSPAAANLPAAQVINVARFDLAYDVEQKGPSGVSRAEVWVTRDDGKTWQRWSTTEKTDSPVTVDLATKNNGQVEGVYGIKIVLLSGAGLSQGPPVSGEAPEIRVDVDLTPPVVKIYEPIPDPNQKDTMILRWQAVDRNLANDPITLEWAEQADGPWTPIVSSDGGTAPLGSNNAVAPKRLANTGQYSWKLPANFPTHRVYIRVTARDTAGNLGDVRSPHPILVDMNKPVARIHGIIGAPAPDRR